MRLDYMAHSCFLIENGGYRVLFDPYEPSIGYPSPRLFSVDAIVVSHEHHDHNAVSEIPGAAQVIRGVARRKIGPLVVDGEVGWHGVEDVAESVSLTLIEWNQRRLAHFGDLGRDLDPDQIERFSDLDLLLIPCGGGGETIDGAQAAKMVELLRPKVAVPMHYLTPFLDKGQFPHYQSVDPFLEGCRHLGQTRFVREGTVDLDEIWSEQSANDTLILHLQHQMA